MNNRTIKILVTCYVSVVTCYFLSGCATAPPKITPMMAMPVYNIGGVSYVPLVSLCEQNAIRWEYDTFTRTVNLTKGWHKANLKVGETLILVDGKEQHLPNPVDIYQGTVVVPLKFKERFSDIFFKEAPPVLKPPSTFVLRIKKVVIDPGHGGNDPGAIGRTGLREKDVNLDIAKRLSKLLADAGIKVILTRSADRFISLERRVDIANNSNADLFISIHSNANRVKGLNGFEVYYVSPNLNDYRRAWSSAQNSKLNLASSCFSYDSLNLRATLWDMIYAASRAESITLARQLCRTIDRDLDTRVLGIKGANFYVLKGVCMPAVLIEIGFVSNLKEERLLKNSYYRQQIAEAVAAGFKEYAKDYTIMEAAK